jgi:quinol monooxygenase YgiN
MSSSTGNGQKEEAGSPGPPVRIIAHGLALPDRRVELWALLQSFIAEARDESGCLRYELWLDEHNPCGFAIIEEWESESALQAHLASPEVRAMGYRLGDLVETTPEVRRYRRLV